MDYNKAIVIIAVVFLLVVGVLGYNVAVNQPAVECAKAGVTKKQLKAWWDKHRAADSERRRVEELKKTLSADDIKLLKKHL